MFRNGVYLPSAAGQNLFIVIIIMAQDSTSVLQTISIFYHFTETLALELNERNQPKLNCYLLRLLKVIPCLVVFACWQVLQV